MKTRCISFLSWTALGALCSAGLDGMRDWTLLGSEALFLAAWIVLVSGSRAGCRKRFMLFLTGGLVCFIIKRNLPYASDSVLELLLFEAAAGAGSAGFSLLCSQCARKTALRCGLLLGWIVVCLAFRSSCQALCLLLSGGAFACLQMKTAGINPFEAGFWKQLEEKRAEKRQLEAHSHLKESLMLHAVEQRSMKSSRL